MDFFHNFLQIEIDRQGGQPRLGGRRAHQRQDEARGHARRGAEDAAGPELEPAQHAASAAGAAVALAPIFFFLVPLLVVLVLYISQLFF